jgi:hypothetical protein
MKTLKANLCCKAAGGGFVHNKRVRFCLFSGTENGILPKGIEKERN